MNKLLISMAVIIIIICSLSSIYFYDRFKYDYNYNILPIPNDARNSIKSYKGYSMSEPLVGLSSTLSFWIYIDNWDYKFQQKKELFHKGGFRGYLREFTNDLVIEIPISSVKIDSNNCRLRYSNGDNQEISLNSTGNGWRNSDNISICPSTSCYRKLNNGTSQCILPDSNITREIQQITYNNIPVQKWVNLIIILDNRNIDLFVDGELYKSRYLKNLPFIIENKPLIMCDKKGFKGKISNINVWKKVIKKRVINHMYDEGPIYKGLFGKFIDAKPPPVCSNNDDSLDNKSNENDN